MGIRKSANLRGRLAKFSTVLLLTLVAFSLQNTKDVFAKNPYYGESYALIIGIDHYLNRSTLPHPVHDSIGIQSTLITYFGFKKKNVLTLYNEKATKKAILNAMKFRFPAKKIKKEDRVLIFFAGHVSSQELIKNKYRGFLVPYDAYPYTEESSCINTNTLKKLTDEIPSNHVLVIIDGCISISSFTRRRTLNIEKFADYLKESTSRKGRQVLVAGDAGDSFGLKGPGKFSLFTGNILTGLKNGKADLNDDGFILASELEKFLKKSMSKRPNQTPRLGSVFGSGGGDMLFTRPDKLKLAKMEKRRHGLFSKEMEKRRQETMKLVKSLVVKRMAKRQAKLVKKTRKKQKQKMLSKQKENIALIKKRIKHSLAKKNNNKFVLDKSLPVSKQEEIISRELKRLKKEEKLIKSNIRKLTAKLKDLENKSPTRKHVPIKTRKTYPDEAEMVFVPAGEFIMGNDDGDYEETPQRKVYLSAYWIDRYEVTNKQYLKFCNDTGYRLPAYIKDKDLNKDNQPVTGVSWDDALAYSKWAKKRLPTEAEWEKAAGGIYSYPFPWGKKYKKNYANLYGRKDGFKYSAPVGSFSKGASYYGCMDMSGNLWEWVNDYFLDNYYQKAPNKDPKGPESGTFRVFRGGSWANYYFVARTTSRNGNFPYYRNQYIVGFRLAK